MSRDPFEETTAPEYGPEWWAQGNELCTCGHRFDDHGEVADWHGDGSGTRFPCGAGAEDGLISCDCQDFTLAP